MTNDSFYSAYCFLHQKWRVYEHSTMEWQKDDIECAISEYADAMDPELYAMLSQGNNAYLKEHSSFGNDMRDALDKMDKMMKQGGQAE